MSAKYEVEIGFVNHSAKQKLTLNRTPDIGQYGSLIIELPDGSAVVYADGHWSGFTVKEIDGTEDQSLTTK